MIEYVRYIHTNLRALGFAKSERLTEGHINVPSPRTKQRVLSEVALRSRQRILKNNISGGIFNCIEGSGIVPEIV